MKKIILHAICSLSLSGFAQKNLFTIPTSDIVETHNLFLQKQFDFGEKLQSGVILTYGLGANWEMGINARDITYQRQGSFIEVAQEKPEENADFQVNIQKGFDIGDWLKLGIGARAGTQLAERVEALEFVNFNYISSKIKVPGTNLKTYLTGYYGNHYYTGGGNNGGFMAGTEIPFYGDKIKLVGDYVSGATPISAKTMGVGFKILRGWEISAGYRIPNHPEQRNSFTLQISSP